MNLQSQRKKSKDHNDQDLEHIEFLISILPAEDKGKIAFVEDFIHRYLMPDAQDGDIITLESLEYKLLKYLLTSLLWRYESSSYVS